MHFNSVENKAVFLRLLTCRVGDLSGSDISRISGLDKAQIDIHKCHMPEEKFIRDQYK